jgi:hypothetical protein
MEQGQCVWDDTDGSSERCLARASFGGSVAWPALSSRIPAYLLLSLASLSCLTLYYNMASKLTSDRNQRILLELATKPGNGRSPHVRVAQATLS